MSTIEENKLDITQKNLEASIDSLDMERISALEKKLEKIEENLERSKSDLILILGVFVALVTYFGLEIQVFKDMHNSFLIVGISFFFMASILLFILMLKTIVSKKEKISCREIILFCILAVLFSGSFYTIFHGDEEPKVGRLNHIIKKHEKTR